MVGEESVSGCWANSVKMAREESLQVEVDSGGTSEGVFSRIGGGREGSLIGCREGSVVGGVGDKSCIGSSLKQIFVDDRVLSWKDGV
jgi:hypothetical protein